MKFYPVAESARRRPGCLCATINTLPRLRSTRTQFTERIDFNESSKSQWFGRYSWNDESTLSPGLTSPTTDKRLYTRASQWVAVECPDPFADQGERGAVRLQLAVQQYHPAVGGHGERGRGVGHAGDGHAIRIPGVFPTSNCLNNLTSFGNPTSSPFQINDKYFQCVDNFSWVIGKHSLRMGGEYRYNEFPQVGNEFPRGQFYFDGQYTNNDQRHRAQTGGYSGADFLMGDMYNSIIAVALAQADFRNSEWAAYIDDTWR